LISLILISLITHLLIMYLHQTVDHPSTILIVTGVINGSKIVSGIEVAEVIGSATEMTAIEVMTILVTGQDVTVSTRAQMDKIAGGLMEEETLMITRDLNAEVVNATVGVRKTGATLLVTDHPGEHPPELALPLGRTTHPTPIW